MGRGFEVLCLQDYQVEVQASVARALGLIGDARAIEPLIAALQDNENHVRTTAKKALRRVRNI